MLSIKNDISEKIICEWNCKVLVVVLQFIFEYRISGLQEGCSTEAQFC